MDIDYLRKEIDTLDSKIVDLLNERAKIVLKIGEIKSKSRRKFMSPTENKKYIHELSHKIRVL